MCHFRSYSLEVLAIKNTFRNKMYSFNFILHVLCGWLPAKLCRNIKISQEVFTCSTFKMIRLTNMIQSLWEAYFRHSVFSFCCDSMGMVYSTLIRMFVVHPSLQRSPQTMQMNKLSKQTNVCGCFCVNSTHRQAIFSPHGWYLGSLIAYCQGLLMFFHSVWLLHLVIVLWHVNKL